MDRQRQDLTSITSFTNTFSNSSDENAENYIFIFENYATL